jgi:hypothetical protein
MAGFFYAITQANRIDIHQATTTLKTANIAITAVFQIAQAALQAISGL